MTAQVPASSLTTTQLLLMAGFNRSDADALDAALVSGGTDSISTFNVVDYGAVGDGATDDRTAFQDCVNAAIAFGKGAKVVIPATSDWYVLSAYVDIASAYWLKVEVEGEAKITYPSDNLSLTAAGVASSDQMARSGFLVRNSTGVTFFGLRLEGSSVGKNLTAGNIGVGIYATGSTYVKVDNCKGDYGYTLFAQDGVTDRYTRIINCDLYGCRGPMRTGDKAVVSGCFWELPGLPDLVGRPASFSVAATTVTLKDYAGRFTSDYNGRLIYINNSTSGGNDGAFALTYVDANTVTYTNASGVSELAAAAGTWWVPGGEKAALGNGASAIAVSAGVVTFTAAAATFASTDVDSTIRITRATTDANDGAYRITEYVSPTVVKYNNAGAVSETYAQTFTVDQYDNSVDGSETFGSTHAFYVFADRDGIEIRDCVCINRRTTFVKASGSAARVRDVQIVNNYALECGEFASLGADDSQEHENFTVANNTIVDCATGRKGWTESVGIEVLGARGVNIVNNQFRYSHIAVRAVDGSPSLAGLYGVSGARYVAGMSQPLEDFTVRGNKFTADPVATTPANILIAAVHLQEVGLLQRNHTGGSLTKSGTTMTCTISNGLLNRTLIGASVEFVNTTGGNDGSFVISDVTSSNVFTYENAGGTGGGNSAGTKRIGAPGNKSGGVCQVVDNEFLSVAPTGVLTQDCVAPTVVNNVFRGCEVNVQFNGDVTPKCYGNRELGRASDTAGIRFNGSGSGVSWPIVYDNHATNNAIGPSRGWGMGIGTASGTRRDYPLLGKTVRCLPSDGKEEVVVAYGSHHVDGDTISVDMGSGAVVYTYKTTAPSGNQFNTFAGLVALINAQTNIDCTDYGTGFVDSAGGAANINTFHLRIRRDTATANTNALLVVCSALYPTALVALPNTASPNTTTAGRGSGTTGPTANKTVVWSPLCSFEGCPVLVPDNAAAATLMAANSYYKVSNTTGYDGGSNDQLTVGTTGGTEQWRARL